MENIMPITFLKMDFVGEQGVSPRLGRMITTDAFEDITQEDYVVPYANAQNIAFEPTDMIAISYSDGRGWFNVMIDGDSVLLSPISEQGDVTVDLPTSALNIPFWDNTAGKLDNVGFVPANTAFPNLVTVEGGNGVHNIAVFYDESGSIEDIGVAFSNPNLPIVASINGATVVNNLPEFADTAGTLRDSGISPTNGALTKVASVSGSTVVGHAASYNDTAGTLVDSGQRMPFATAVSGAAGSATVVFTVAGAALADACWFAPNTIVNPVAQVSCAATGTNQVTVVFTGNTGGVAGYVWVQKAP
jgi:hypothetical protein